MDYYIGFLITQLHYTYKTANTVNGSVGWQVRVGFPHRFLKGIDHPLSKLRIVRALWICVAERYQPVQIFFTNFRAINLNLSWRHIRRPARWEKGISWNWKINRLDQLMFVYKASFCFQTIRVFCVFRGGMYHLIYPYILRLLHCHWDIIRYDCPSSVKLTWSRWRMIYFFLGLTMEESINSGALIHHRLRFFTLQWRHMGARTSQISSLLFTQPFIRAQIKETIKASRRWPLCGEFTGDRWIPCKNGQ